MVTRPSCGGTAFGVVDRSRKFVWQFAAQG